MDKKEKKEKKREISNHIDLGNGRFKDDEVNTLHELATNRKKYNGKSKTIKHKGKSWDSDGRYDYEEETTYTLKGDDKGVRIEERYQYHTDDGIHRENNTVFKTGRDILNLFKSFFK